MQVVLFCGGQGTRMREETEFRPKPMVTIGGKPVLWHIMKTYAHFGHTDFVLCLGYKGNMIKEYFLNYRAMNNDFTVKLGDHTGITYHDKTDEDHWNVTLADTGENTMTGARLFGVQRHLKDDVFMVTYGDGLSDVNIDALVAFHKSHGKIATVTAVKTISRFGLLKINDQQVVEHFAEKPDIEGRINSGYFVFDRRIFDYVSADPSCILEKEPLQNLALDGQLMAFNHENFFYAMDTYRESLHLNELWNEGKAPWAHWLKTDANRAMLAEKAKEEAVRNMLHTEEKARV